MKKITFFLLMFFSIYLPAFSVDIVDLGSDWNGSELVDPISGIKLDGSTKEFILNQGLATEVLFKLNGGSVGSDNKSVYKNTTASSIGRWEVKTDHTDYLEVNATSGKKITQIKLNGTSDKTDATAIGAILYSNVTPFDETKITGYGEIELAMCRAGNTGVTISDHPAGAQSFRVYKKVKITRNGDFYKILDEGDITVGVRNTLRVAYMAVTIDDVAPVVTPTIGLTTANNTQTVYPNEPIRDIVYKWGGTATDAAIAWNPSQPEGISVDKDSENKTLTVKGTPTDNVSATYAYSVTSSDATQTSEPLTGTITVKTTMKKKLAYVTNSNDAARRDDAFTTALGADFDVNIINSATTGVNYDVYDIIVLSAVPASGDAGLAELKNVSITKPFVNMKTYQLQSSRWNWLTPANNPGKTTVTVTAAGKTHPLFAGFDFNASDDVILTTKTDGNMVVTFSGWIGDSDPAIVLATEKESGNASYAEIPTGTIVNGMTNPTSAKHIILGLSEAAWDGLTEAAVTLCVNAAKYAADIQTPVKIIKNSPKTVVNKQYFDLSGRVVTPKAKGFVIEKSYYEDGSASFEKLFKK